MNLNFFTYFFAIPKKTLFFVKLIDLLNNTINDRKRKQNNRAGHY